MDDGSRQKDGGYYIALCSFSLEDINLLKSALLTNFNLHTVIHKGGKDNQYNLYIPATHANFFKSIIYDFIHPSLYYKLHE
jgi:hypothetical protein